MGSNKIYSGVDEELAKSILKRDITSHTHFISGYALRRHHLAWAKALESSIKRLVIIAPPKYGKTPTVAIDYLGWRIGLNPDFHALYLSNTAAQAHKASVALRDTIAKNKRYNWLYGLEPDYDKGWGEGEWFVTRKNLDDKDPTIQATGVHGPILGATVEEVVFDDIADEENMATEYQREQLMLWVRKIAMSRLVPGGRAIMICTRWHEDDPAAQFIADGWPVMELDAHNEDGKSTYPEYWTDEDLAEAERALGHRNYQLVFRHRVLPDEGSIFKKQWWRYYDERVEIPGVKFIVQVWDTAFEAKKKNDYTAMETWAIGKGAYYLIDAWRGKVTFPNMKQTALDFNRKHHPNIVLIEDTGSGKDLKNVLLAETIIPVKGITVSKDKVARANAASPTVEAGKVHLPKNAPWKPPWEYEHEAFPGAKNDDWVDCTTMFLNWARMNIAEEPMTASGVDKESIWK